MKAGRLCCKHSGFPGAGIIFRDITSILQDPDGFKLAIDSLLAMVKNVDFDVVVGAESRGFIFGTPVAYEMGKSFVPARKPGKLQRDGFYGVCLRVRHRNDRAS